MTREEIKQQIEQQKLKIIELEILLNNKEKNYLAAAIWIGEFMEENFESGRASVKIKNNYVSYSVGTEWVFEKDRDQNIFWVCLHCFRPLFDKYNLDKQDVLKMVDDYILELFDSKGYKVDFQNP